MVTLLNEGDIMEKNGWVCLHQTSSVRFNLMRNTFKIVSAALLSKLIPADELNPRLLSHPLPLLVVGTQLFLLSVV